MAKNSALKKQELEDEIDFSEMLHSPYEDEVINDMLGNLIQVSNQQMGIALELTKLIVDKNMEKSSENAILDIFKKASKTVADNFPLKSLWEKMG